MPLLKNGDRLVIYTAADARSALKISRTGVPAPDGFLYFSRLVFSLPPFFLLSSYFSSSPPCRFFYARLIYPSLRTASARTARSGSFLDFSWFFSHFFRHFSKDTSLLSRVSPLRSFHRPSYPLRHSVSKVYPGRLSRNERVAPTGGGFLECARHRSHYRLLIERTTISSINHGADFAPCAWMHRREIQAARI